MTQPPLPSVGWLHIVFNDDPKRIFLYRKSEVYRAVITEKDIELLIDQASIVITSAPTHGTVSVNANGTVSYQHDGSETAADPRLRLDASSRRLATELNVSRTPMREALMRLAGEGLLEKTADGVFRVRSVSIREFFECMEVRELLECHAIERAIAVARDADLKALYDELKALPPSSQDDLAHWQFDNRFHSFFATTAQNQALARAIQRERVVARLFRISTPFHRQTESDEEHVEIMEAVMKRDVKSAQAAMRRHLQNLQTDARREIESQAYPIHLTQDI